MGYKRRSNGYGNGRNSAKALWEFLVDNKKRVMPIILLICVAATILIAIQANKAAADKAIADADKQDETSTGVNASEAVLSKDSYPEINALIAKYFEAYTSGDVTILNSGIYRTLDEIEAVTVEERARYIEEIQNLAVYTKPGPVENSWIAYVYTEVRYIGCDDFLPGVVSFYICCDDDGTYYINADESAQSVKDYVNAISLQDDVVELYNKVNVEYKERLDADPMLSELVAAIYAEIDESVGERLAGADAVVADAQAQAENNSANQGTAGSDASNTASTEKELPKEVKIRATTTVNVRASDSTEAAVVGKAREGEEYVRILEQPNGWSKISFAGSAAYVKSEYFVIVTDDEQQEGQADAGTGASTQEPAGETAAQAETLAAATGGSTSPAAGASTAASDAASTAASAASTAASTASSAASTSASAASTASSAASKAASTGASAAASTGASAGTSASTGASSSAGTGASASSAAASSQKAAGVTGTGKKMINANGVRIRTSPDTDSEIVTTLYFGTQVEVTKNRTDGWSEIKYNGKTAYVKTEFLVDL
ncbi:MAG: SH3 domain-containing protein [Lachnospiraceae bacterium]|nr:SH3 domain-containing protein [Lachnospiraceae bacterium]